MKEPMKKERKMKIHQLMLGLSLAALGCGNTTSPSPDGGGGGGAGTVTFTASGEVLALGGYAYPPATADDPAFVDGWEVKFTSLITTIDKINLSTNPDKSETDQSLTDAKVAEVTGPWAVDLHQGGPLQGKGGADEQAVQITTLSNQNLNGGKAFDDTVRYAFGFDLIPAAAAATKINLDAEGQTDYAEMVAKGWVVLYKGHASWKGNGAGGAACTSSIQGYDFGTMPTEVDFKIGFKSPTTYKNCQNPDNDPAKALGSDEHQRGVQIKTNTATIAQVTVHTDHPFWESFTHDSPPHFDQLAALAKKDAASGKYTVTIDETVGVSYKAFKDPAGTPLPWRGCLAGYMAPATTQMGFDSLTIPYTPGGDPSKAMRDYADYLLYNQSTQGHLNSDGLCYVSRNYPSPL
jgi:hypothetical protein